MRCHPWAVAVLTDQDGLQGLKQHGCISSRIEKQRRKKTLYRASMADFKEVPESFHTLSFIAHWSQLCHMVAPNCMGSWGQVFLFVSFFYVSLKGSAKTQRFYLEVRKSWILLDSYLFWSLYFTSIYLNFLVYKMNIIMTSQYCCKD